jgi:hypothetical protein
MVDELWELLQTALKSSTCRCPIPRTGVVVRAASR